MRKTFPIKLLALLIFLMSGFLKSSAQINADGQQHNVVYTGSDQGFVIPNNTLITKIRFSLSGADGGAAILNMGEWVPFVGFVTTNTYKAGGGKGAVVNATFLVGTGAGKIPHGSAVRFIIGGKGQTGSDNIGYISEAGTGAEYGGGGGGTAILYRALGASTWTLLAVAGGGGGAYQASLSGVAIGLGDNGGAGEESENGGDGHGIIDQGIGGMYGNGGGANFGWYYISPVGAGGGGRFRGGTGLYKLGFPITEENEFGEGGAGSSGGSEEGGYGGSLEFQPSELTFNFRDGGFGYGGGGASAGTGGGGGGYSGGGSGGSLLPPPTLLFRGGGGGGGSYLNGIRETGNVSSGGSDTEPDDGFAQYQVTLNHPPVANCKNVSVYLNANGQASIVASDINNGSSDEDGDALTYSLSISSFSCSNLGPNTVTLTVTDIYGATATCTATVTVVDNIFPVITCSPNITVSCAADVAAANNASVTVTDNCPVTITHEGDVITNQTCANRFTLTRTYRATDASGNSTTCQQVITVNDNQAPVISNASTSVTSLWPANHKMHDVTLAYTITDNCTVASTQISITSNETGIVNGDGNTNPDWEILDNYHIRLRAERSGTGTGRIYTITITTTDGCNVPTVATLQVVVAHNIKAPITGAPFKIGSAVDLAGEFWDKPGNSHTAKWLIDNSTIVNGVVTAPSGNQNGKVTGSYKFNTAGVYKLQMNVTDQTGITSYANTNGELDAIVVIYDPNGGYTYGGGWFQSPAGALVKDRNAKGHVSYGYTVNYYKGATKPKGETQFKFGDLEFNAVNFDYLAISGARAQFKGTGKIIGGQSGLGFIMTVIDGAIDGSGIDKVRMKIYNKTNGAVIYDNQPGTSDVVNPTVAIGNNSSIVVQNTSVVASAARSGEVMETDKTLEVQSLEVTVQPNPSHSHFSLSIKSPDVKSRISIQVYDANGRLVEVKSNISAGSQIEIGNAYKSGIYLVKIVQGKNHKELKLIKVSY